MISHQCPKCGNTLRIPDQYAGQRGSCTKCGNAITVPASSHEAPQAGIVKTSLPRASVLNKLSRTQTGCLVAFILFGAFCLIGIMNPESAEQRAEREVKQLEQRRARELRVDQGRLEREAKQRKREDQRQAEREAKQRESEQRQRKRQRDFEQRQREREDQARASREEEPKTAGPESGRASRLILSVQDAFIVGPEGDGLSIMRVKEWGTTEEAFMHNRVCSVYEGDKLRLLERAGFFGWDIRVRVESNDTRRGVEGWVPSKVMEGAKEAPWGAGSEDLDKQERQQRTKQWFEGGTLHQSTLAEWKQATHSNKLATASDWLAATKWRGRLDSLKDFDRLREKSQMLADGIDELASVDGVDFLSAKEMAASIITMSTDLGPS